MLNRRFGSGLQRVFAAASRAKVGLRHFRQGKRGSITIVVAFALIPLIVAVGVSVDYLRGLSVRASLQSAVDAAALAGASQSSRNAGTVVTNAKSYFKANGPPSTIATVGEPTVAYDTSAQTVTVTGMATMATSLMRVVGIRTMDIAASATAAYRGTPKAKAEIVLALDGSKSVNGSSWPDSISRTNFQVAVQAKEFVNLVNNSLGDNARYGLVPFTSLVRLNQAAPPPGVAAGTGGIGTVPTCSCNGSPGNCEGGNYMCGGGSSTWTGCVGVRSASLLSSVSDAATSTYPRIYGSCMTPRAYELSAYADIYLRVADVQTQTNGNTFIPGALTWAWNMLTPEIPFTTAAPNTDTTVLKVVVLISDGVNTASPRYPNGDVVGLATVPSPFYTTRTQVDTLTRTLCQNMKAYGIKIFTVRVPSATGDAASAQLLRDCASDPSMAYELTTYWGTPATFATLAQAVIAALRDSGGGGPPYLLK